MKKKETIYLEEQDQVKFDTLKEYFNSNKTLTYSKIIDIAYKSLQSDVKTIEVENIRNHYKEEIARLLSIVETIENKIRENVIDYAIVKDKLSKVEGVNIELGKHLKSLGLSNENRKRDIDKIEKDQKEIFNYIEKKIKAGYQK
jgi:hypothetical protein